MRRRLSGASVTQWKAGCSTGFRDCETPDLFGPVFVEERSVSPDCPQLTQCYICQVGQWHPTAYSSRWLELRVCVCHISCLPNPVVPHKLDSLLLAELLPVAVTSVLSGSLFYKSLDTAALKSHIEAVEDQDSEAMCQGWPLHTFNSKQLMPCRTRCGNCSQAWAWWPLWEMAPSCHGNLLWAWA